MARRTDEHIGCVMEELKNIWKWPAVNDHFLWEKNQTLHVIQSPKETRNLVSSYLLSEDSQVCNTVKGNRWARWFLRKKPELTSFIDHY